MRESSQMIGASRFCQILFRDRIPKIFCVIESHIQTAENLLFFLEGIPVLDFNIFDNLSL